MSIAHPAGRDYETVAAGQTAQALGVAGAVGNDLDRLIIVPATAAPGEVTLLDGATSIPVYVGGASQPLLPIVVDVNAKSKVGAWKVTTGANVSVIAIGRFS
jgi:hypothetical protein